MKVLFVCYANQNRSQIAEALFNRLSRKNSATSAGLAPPRDGILLKDSLEDGNVYPPIVQMKEKGYDSSKARIKKLNNRRASSADKIVFLFDIKKHWDDIPAYAKESRGVEYWEVPSIKNGITYEEYSKLERKRIKVIEKRVKDLVKRIG